MLILYLLCTSVSQFLLNSFICCHGYWFTDEYSVINNINKPYYAMALIILLQSMTIVILIYYYIYSLL